MNSRSLKPSAKYQKLQALQFPLFRTRLIEASAGTGKTWTIAALYIRLVLGHGSEGNRFERALLPPEILVVTFTEAATRELRDRIRLRLNQAAACFRGREVGDSFLQEIKNNYAETQWPGCARLLETSALWMDEAAVYTIHGWCNRMLQQHAFDSGSLFKQEVNTTDQELLHEVVRDYWRCFFYTLSEAEVRAVATIAESPQDLAGFIQRLLDQTDAHGLENAVSDPRDLFARWANWDETRNALEQQARRLWHDARAELEDLLREASEQGWLSGTSYRKNSFEQRLQDFASWAEGGERPKTEWFFRFAQSQFNMNRKHEGKTPQHPAFAAIEAIRQHESAEPVFEVELIVHAAWWVRERYAREKHRRARIDFNDMLTRLDLALQGDADDRLAAIIRRQFPVALIDEFQDTDPLQYRIFKRIYQPDAPEQILGCFMIGDPKQAIYSFRGADIHTYLQAHADTAGRHYTLDTNFRSTAALVAAVNSIFQYAEAAEKGAFLFKNAETNPVAFNAVLAQGVAESFVIEGKPAAAVTFCYWGVDQEKPLGSELYRQHMACLAATEIVRLLTLAAGDRAGFSERNTTYFRALQPSDIAILVRTRKEAKAIQTELARRCVRSVYLSEGDSVFNSREAADMLLWLKACAEPRNERKVRAALASATLNLSLQELSALTRDEAAWEQQLDRFRAYQLRWQKDGVLPMLRSMLSDFQVYSRLINGSADSGGERTLTNLLHLAELLQKATTHLDGEQALLRYLAEAMAAAQTVGSRSADETTVRLESDANLIQIITIHKAKGLEYPVVFLPFIASFREVTSRYTRFYRYHDDSGALQIDLSCNEENREKNDFERLQEDMRLLYVALTRAKQKCWLGVAPLKALEKSAFGYLLGWRVEMTPQALPEKLLALAGACTAIEVAPAGEPNEATYTAGGSAGIAIDPTALRTATTPISDIWWIASYSAMKLEADGNLPGDSTTADTAHDDNWLDEAVLDLDINENQDAVLSATQPSGIHAFPRGAESGAALHELMEYSARQGFRELTAAELEQFCRSKGWAEWTETLQRSFGEWLALPLFKDDAISLQQLQCDAYQPELEFLLPVRHLDLSQLDALITHYTFNGRPRRRLLHNTLQGMLKGFIDLVFEHEQRYYIVDYKFNTLGAHADAYTLEALEDAMLKKRYDLQYSLYLLALHRQLKARLAAVYDYDTHIGGALYLFLRGSAGPCQGRVLDRPPKIMIETLDALLA